ncbi:MAG: hypothetical protein BWX72_01533 [Firmicutes bacterium ADurb.Bin080]|jgi:uncharacterized membrane protein|nr:DUF1700 domain-containing protein [Clostridiales bacterium]OQC13826.1 MAG: hypothetical protein BWX72_01533 [Firmicutes bacterium ADurb.Bin080]
MNKRDFFRIIRKKLNRFGDDVADDAVEFYEEIINEKIRETGISEEQAIADLGDPNKLAVEMASDLVAANKLKNPSRGMFWLLGSLALSPVLLPLAITAFTLYIVIFSVWGSLTIAFGGAAIGSIIGGVYSLFVLGNIGTSLICLGGALIAAAILSALCIVTFKYGLEFINLITVKLVRKIKKKTDKGDIIK